MNNSLNISLKRKRIEQDFKQSNKKQFKLESAIFSQIPIPLWIQIFGYLNLSDIKIMRQLNHEFRNIIQSIWKQNVPYNEIDKYNGSIFPDIYSITFDLRTMDVLTHTISNFDIDKIKKIKEICISSDVIYCSDLGEVKNFINSVYDKFGDDIIILIYSTKFLLWMNFFAWLIINANRIPINRNISNLINHFEKYKIKGFYECANLMLQRYYNPKELVNLNINEIPFLEYIKNGQSVSLIYILLQPTIDVNNKSILKKIMESTNLEFNNKLILIKKLIEKGFDINNYEDSENMLHIIRKCSEKEIKMMLTFGLNTNTRIQGESLMFHIYIQYVGFLSGKAKKLLGLFLQLGANPIIMTNYVKKIEKLIDNHKRFKKNKTQVLEMISNQKSFNIIEFQKLIK